MDKTFGDCSIPQEKSNADINEELELSDASCEEDACNTRLNTSQLRPKQPIGTHLSSDIMPNIFVCLNSQFINHAILNQPSFLMFLQILHSPLGSL